MVPLDRIGLSTPPLPRECSTTEPQRHDVSIVTHLFIFGKDFLFFLQKNICNFFENMYTGYRYKKGTANGKR